MISANLVKAPFHDRMVTWKLGWTWNDQGSSRCSLLYTMTYTERRKNNESILVVDNPQFKKLKYK